MNLRDKSSALRGNGRDDSDIASTVDKEQHRNSPVGDGRISVLRVRLASRRSPHSFER